MLAAADPSARSPDRAEGSARPGVPRRPVAALQPFPVARILWPGPLPR